MLLLGLLELGFCLLLLALIEVALFWAASSLADAPSLGLVKTFAIALGVAAVWGALAVAVGWSSGLLRQPLTAESRPAAISLAAVVLAITWAVPAVLYTPLLPVPFARGMMISVFQVLLRGFLYVLIAAVVFVGLAVAQIVSAPS